MLEGILLGVTTAITPENLALVLTGCLAGTFIGMLPGLGPITAIALMIPVTYRLDPASGLILLAGVYYGAVFGGSTSSILINAPGIAGTVASSFDGYPLARRGQPGKALAVAAYASFAGGTLAALMLLLAAPYLAGVSTSFQSADYFALMVLGLALIAAFAGPGDYLKAVMMMLVGLMLATVGTDPTSGVQRFTFGRMDLMDGIDFVLLAMATFALSEALMMVLRTDRARHGIDIDRAGLKLSGQEVKDIVPPITRSSVLGFIVGILPGAGATIASFLAYGMERSFASRTQQTEFGQGSLKGLAAPETANNAACTGSFVPLLTLGIPGSGTTAVLLGALVAYGVQPGPRLYVEQPEIFWSVIVSMYVGNLILLVLNLPLIPYIARLLALPHRMLVPLILFFSLVGVYLVSANSFDIHLMVTIAVGAVALRLLGFPMAPLLLGFILGGMIEENLRRALTLSGGDLWFFWERPTTRWLLIAALAALLSPGVMRARALIAGRPSAQTEKG